MAGAQNAYRANISSSLGVISVTAGTDNFFDPKSGLSLSQYGYISAANSLNGGAVGSRTPTTLLGATINGIYEDDDDTAGQGYFRLKLNGDQTALTISRAEVNGTVFTFGAPSFSGGQTTWSSSVHAAGNPFGGSPKDVTFN